MNSSFTRRSFLRSSSAVTISSVLVAAGVVLPVAAHAQDEASGGPGSPIYIKWDNPSQSKEAKITVEFYEKRGSQPETLINSEEKTVAPGGNYEYNGGNALDSWRIKIIKK